MPGAGTPGRHTVQLFGRARVRIDYPGGRARFFDREGTQIIERPQETITCDRLEHTGTALQILTEDDASLLALIKQEFRRARQAGL